jgi:WD40 repeat protein
VCCVRFSADGKYLATGCNRTAQIYDTKTGQKTWCVFPSSFSSPLPCILSPSSQSFHSVIPMSLHVFKLTQTFFFSHTIVFLQTNLLVNRVIYIYEVFVSVLMASTWLLGRKISKSGYFFFFSLLEVVLIAHDTSI